ncbi:hypothetical protein M433DRAFT_26642 [Acidomyces richmondensis BFW]|nr:MAG: hypothetical protein FE78DRAFT_41555 [Acidomyces sp. 'richmondensis']KYG42784.1 hypothetical protein M433DRAFT_26642 [Acidomyces richmondensis BFW]
MARRPPMNPLVAVVGATGTGKSELAVQLAKKFNGEIINGDAMQLYAGLPVITNKIPPEEQQGIPHHLLGCIGLEEQTWVVGKFVQRALTVIEDIRNRGKLPILVGGTHYYTQSLLFYDRLADIEDIRDNGDFARLCDQKGLELLQQPTEALLKELEKVDPVIAQRWHPNDRRKILRSLEIYLKTGKTASQLYAQQRANKATLLTHEGSDGKTLVPDALMRFPTLLFWVHTEMESLRKRLDLRVDKMLKAGLLDEIQKLNAYAVASAAEGREIDETRGIWVSIGYKEFRNYARALENSPKCSDELESLRLDALERTKIATRQYAKRQVRWIRIKLLNALSAAAARDSIYLLDSSNATEFEQTVVGPATELTSLFLKSQFMPSPVTLSTIAAEQLQPKRDFEISARPEIWIKKHCEICNVTCVMKEHWEQHIKSKGHKKRISKKHQKGDSLAKDSPRLFPGHSTEHIQPAEHVREG